MNILSIPSCHILTSFPLKPKNGATIKINGLRIYDFPNLSVSMRVVGGWGLGGGLMITKNFSASDEKTSWGALVCFMQSLWGPLGAFGGLWG